MLLSPRLSVALVIVAVTFLSDVTMHLIFFFFRFCRNTVMKGQEDSVCVLSNVHTQNLQHSSSVFQKTQIFCGLINIFTHFNFITQQKGALL